MLPRSVLRFVLAGCAAAAALSSGAAIAQEQPAEFQSWRLPGWTFTPGVIFGGLYDTNVAVAFPQVRGAATASDKLFQVQPFGQLEFFNPRTMFSSGYQGSLRRYVQFDELDDAEHRGYLSLRRLMTRRLTYFLTDSFVRVPTTDRLELNGVPFQRTGARYDALATGIEARLTRSTDFTARYDLTWVDFERKDTPLTGGYVNGAHTSLAYRFTERSSLGGEYGVRWATLNHGTRDLAFQQTGTVFRYRSGPETTFEAAVGYAHLADRSRDITRTGPYARVGLTRRGDRATVGAEFERSYVPSLAFGGTNQSQELRGYVQMPLNRNRLYVQEMAAWRRTDPLIEGELPLDGIWTHTTVGYALARWLRIEGYHSFTRQDTRVTNGQISRHLAGVQFVVSAPMRIR